MDTLPSLELKNRHLLRGESPILACIEEIGEDTLEAENDDQESSKKIFTDLIEQNKGNVHDIDYLEDVDEMNKKGFLNPGLRSYVISTIDTYDKFSKDFINCTGLIVVGRDRKSGKNISFFSHQNGSCVLESEREKFVAHLKERLLSLKERCIVGTIDAVVAGGVYFDDGNNERPQSETSSNMVNQYVDLVNLLSGEIREVLDFNPVIINGPKIKRSLKTDHIYFNNENRRLYLVRPKGSFSRQTGSLTLDDLDDERKKWK